MLSKCKVFISIISCLLAPGWSVCICSSCPLQTTNQIQASKVSKIRAFLLGTAYWQIHIMCQWLMTAPPSEWLNVTELSWIHFKLHWIKASGFKCDWLHQEPKRHWTFGITLAPWLQEILEIRLSSFQEVIPQPKHLSPWVWPLVYVCIMHFKCVFTCVLTHFMCMFSIEGYFWGSNCVKFQAKFEPASLTRNVLFVFYLKSRFCCKMHMQKFCTEVTILP